jgi:hypothetical protein
VDKGRKGSHYKHTHLTLDERLNLIGDVEVAIKSHDVGALPVLVSRCELVANGQALIKRLRDALESNININIQ